MSKHNYFYIEKCKDKNILYSNLNNNDLNIIEKTLEAYSLEKIELTTEYKDYENYCYLTIKDTSYEENGLELLILKWYEDYETTNCLVEIFK